MRNTKLLSAMSFAIVAFGAQAQSSVVIAITDPHETDKIVNDPIDATASSLWSSGMVCAVSMLFAATNAMAFGALAISEDNHAVAGISENRKTQKLADDEAMKWCRYHAENGFTGSHTPGMQRPILGGARCHVVERFHRAHLYFTMSSKDQTSGWSVGQPEEESIADPRGGPINMWRAMDKCMAVSSIDPKSCRLDVYEGNDESDRN